MVTRMTATHVEPGEELSDVVARRVRGMLAETRMKQAELALALGISPAAMSDRLRGVKDFDLKELAPLAAALQTSEPYLLGFTDERSPRPENRTGAVVRQQGLEPRTRWLSVAPDLPQEPPAVLRPSPVVVPFARPEQPSAPAAAARTHLSLVEEVAS